MIRLVLLLCAGLYFALMVLGEDRGQKRYGLMLADQQVSEVVPAAPVVEASEQVVFIPSQTVMEQPVVAAPVVAETAPAAPVITEVATASAEPLPEPEVPGGELWTISANSANVRQGPGTTFGVLGSLGQGEQVLVLAEESPIEGWSKVRLEGDGVEGYIATRLLTQ